jgi:hypothetical protein
MKEVAILLLMALLLNGCGSSTRTVQTGAGGIWQAALYGGVGSASGFSFITEFTVNGTTLDVSSFQFLTSNTGSTASCFPISGGTVSGTMPLQVQTNDAVTGTLKFTVQSNGNTLTLSGIVTGTATSSGTPPNTTYTLTSSSVAGTWALTGSTGCSATGGSFTMTES